MQTLIAVPVFNEQRHLPRLLGEVARWGYDLLVVDDGSTDATGDILSDTRDVTVIRHSENRGYGASLIDAFQYAGRHRYDWIVTLDSDYQHEPARIPSFIERAARGDVDLVSGSRYLVDLPGNTEAPEERRRINGRITRMARSILGLPITDAFCGFKAHRVKSLGRLKLSEPGYAFPIQLWVETAAAGLRVCELPVPLIYNDPNRHFGGNLDDPQVRLHHYIRVFLSSYRASTLSHRLVAG